jgi:catechol 2,3-dioxygenase-like lactoylglutathione lyase family enzyme
MFDHMSIGVRDLGAAGRFYEALLAPLGHEKTWAQERELAYGADGARQFWLYPVSGDQVAGLGVHIAFRAETQAAVDEAYAAALENGAQTVRAAGFHPDIGPDYYGAIVFDHDGHKIEIVVGAMH